MSIYFPLSWYWADVQSVNTEHQQAKTSIWTNTEIKPEAETHGFLFLVAILQIFWESSRLTRKRKEFNNNQLFLQQNVMIQGAAVWEKRIDAERWFASSSPLDAK